MKAIPHGNKDSDIPASTDVPPGKLWIVLRRAYQAIAGCLEAGVISRGFKLADFMVLEVLLHKGPLSAKAIAARTKLDQSSVDLVVSRLLSQTLIEAKTNAGQPNRQVFHLARVGHEVINGLYQAHENDIIRVFDILPAQHQVELYKALRKVGLRAAERADLVRTDKKGALTAWQLQQAQGYMTTHLAERLSIEDVARSIELSHSTFRRAFKAATGIPPHRWLLQARVKRAQRHLREGSMTLADIAAATGFLDQSHFSRSFKQVMGVSPRAWQLDHSLH